MGNEGRPGRPEGPLDPATGAVADLAARLRQLRQDAGRPSYRQLARSAYYSHSALSQAAAGRVLPSLPVTLAFVEACGGDRQEWIARWHEAAVEAGLLTEPDGQALSAEQAMDASPAIDARPTVDARPADAGRRGIRGRLTRTRPGYRLLATAGLAGLAAILVWWGLSAGLTTMPGGLPAPASDGDSSSPGYCASSWVNLDSSQVLSNGRVLGWVVLRYSTRCGTVWARFSPASSFSGTKAVTITVEVTRQPGRITQVSRELYAGHLQSKEIPLPHGGCALASITVASQGQAPASASTACRPPPPSR